MSEWKKIDLLWVFKMLCIYFDRDLQQRKGFHFFCGFRFMTSYFSHSFLHSYRNLAWKLFSPSYQPSSWLSTLHSKSTEYFRIKFYFIHHNRTLCMQMTLFLCTFSAFVSFFYCSTFYSWSLNGYRFGWMSRWSNLRKFILQIKSSFNFTY